MMSPKANPNRAHTLRVQLFSAYPPRIVGHPTTLNAPTIFSDSSVSGLVVEDAPSGLKAGRAAGAQTLAVCTSHQRQTLLRDANGNLDYIVQDLEGSVALLCTQIAHS